jgi:hypothetical protein
MSLPKIQPTGANPTAYDFTSMQTQWAQQLNPVIAAANSTDGVGIGTVLQWGGNPPLENYLQCNAQTVLQSLYKGLFQVIGTNFNTGGEPAGSFRLPPATSPVKSYIKYQ